MTGAELVERCRAVDPATTPSTVYRTLDVLEELGIVRHAHGADGREEFHVLPEADHGHLHCLGCRETWEIEAGEAAALVATLQAERGFAVELSHLSISGLCRGLRGRCLTRRTGSRAASPGASCRSSPGRARSPPGTIRGRRGSSP